jgi:hypothetical protein|mmetsp:Transcript_2214/g.7290  ORF Transcript_2214/g.7290 Transcript_2214/m.7290 type:complete len:126 (-) Transcript_2214:364-741(-)|eukprot:CAMPEP_0202754956 /NCGR_PEP_ID=MMETSP1388-20130828/14676_1 /ASSEMBLY_ACC=CAM_ASM_000864 /TAXON_ID=37098 /ORGANISM="Isochrysis sp, Strain CCMP1244" /LENGTH=125 /DNA_ID=CAMNT_0049422741 /DNA_START=83 /DNA_END=460 /DNA_ORIENTATION=+
MAKLSSLLLLVVAVSAQALMPTTRAGGTAASSPVAASPRPRTTPVVLASNPIMEFFESLVQKSSTLGKDITLAEAKELCRDPESSGCSIDMLDMIESEKATYGATAAEAAVKWSAAIDDAVVKTE